VGGLLENMRRAQGILMGNFKGKDHLAHLDLDGGMILNCTLKN
jgi:hypothetical protein